MMNFARCQATTAGVMGIGVKINTELGAEKQCITCGEFWPADTEFFEPKQKTRDRLSTRCIACVKEGNWSSVLL